MPCNALNLTTKIVISISSTTKLTSQELMALINNIYVIVVALDSKIDTPEPKPIVSLAAQALGIHTPYIDKSPAQYLVFVL